MNNTKTLAQTLYEQHEADMIRRAETIRDWRPSPERTAAAEAHVRFALHDTPSRISEATQYRIYSILHFVMPDDAWREGEQVPDEVLDEQAKMEAAYQEQLSRQVCEECGDGVCPVGD